MLSRKHWALPDEKFFTYSEGDWLLLLLQHVSSEQRDLVRLLFWRAWSVRNNIVHNSGPISIESSVHFLLSYQATLVDVQQNNVQDTKGKGRPARLVKIVHSVAKRLWGSLNCIHGYHQEWAGQK